MIFEKEIGKLVNQCFHRPIPDVLKERARHERELFQSILYQLKKQKLILLRTADDQNTYYLGQIDEFEKKTRDYIDHSSCYLYMGMITKKITENDHLKDILQLIDSQLSVLKTTQIINHDQLSRFCMNKRTNLKLPHLYFLPNTTDDVQMSVQPRFSWFKNSPVRRLAQYLEQIIRPLFNNICGSSTVLHGNDFIRKFGDFSIRNSHETTHLLYGTYKLHDLYANIPHDVLLDSLCTLLANPLIIGRHDRLSNDAIVKLTSIVLRNNYFIYQNEVYRFIQGCPLNLTLSKLLGNIYLHHWQIPLIRQIRIRDTFYVRFHDQGFVVWNGSIDELQTIFNELEQVLPSDIQMISFISKQVHFLNCHIENINGCRYTKVHRDENTQHFVLPYGSGHPRLIHRKWYRFMMIRAVQYCRDYEDFEDERRYIEATFLANGYSLDFIEYLWRQLIKRYKFSPIELELLDKHKLYAFYLEVNRQMKYTMENNEQTEEYNLMKSQKLIRLNYLYDWGLRCEFNKKFQDLWTSIINEDPIFKKNDLKLVLKSKHCYLSNTLLTHQ